MSKYTSNKPARDIQQEITDRIISELESGNLPWLKPWKNGKSAAVGIPYNAASKSSYHGINVIMLWGEAMEKGYSTDAWMTFQQAKEKGGSVRKGEHGCPVVFWSFKEYENEETGDKKKIPFVKYSTVFNLEQIDGLDGDKVKRPGHDTDIADAIENAAEFCRATGAQVIHGGNEACFIPSRDLVRMPNFAQFNTAQDYYATLLHELTHWSGGKPRLARDLSGRFGSEKYAAEELIAEMGAAFLCAELGIEGKLQHAAYIQSWLKVLTNDKRAIFTAASYASKAAEFLKGATATEEKAAA